MLDLYPEMEFDVTQVGVSVPSKITPLLTERMINLALEGHWVDVENRKKLFDSYAKDNKFDPLVSENWYSVKKEDVLKVKVIADSMIRC